MTESKQTYAVGDVVEYQAAGLRRRVLITAIDPSKDYPCRFADPIRGRENGIEHGAGELVVPANGAPLRYCQWRFEGSKVGDWVETPGGVSEVVHVSERHCMVVSGPGRALVGWRWPEVGSIVPAPQLVAPTPQEPCEHVLRSDTDTCDKCGKTGEQVALEAMQNDPNPTRNPEGLRPAPPQVPDAPAQDGEPDANCPTGHIYILLDGRKMVPLKRTANEIVHRFVRENPPQYRQQKSEGGDVNASGNLPRPGQVASGGTAHPEAGPKKIPCADCRAPLREDQVKLRQSATDVYCAYCVQRDNLMVVDEWAKLKDPKFRNPPEWEGMNLDGRIQAAQYMIHPEPEPRAPHAPHDWDVFCGASWEEP